MGAGPRGPLPKPAAKRLRRNHVSGAAEFQDEPRPPRRPKLGERADGMEWHPKVLEWWGWTWRSQLAREYIRLDLSGLFVAAELYQDFWMAEEPRTRRELAAELAKQLARYGQSPSDRRRLQWEIKRVEAEKPAQRPSQPKNGAQPVDPRRLLSAV